MKMNYFRYWVVLLFYFVAGQLSAQVLDDENAIPDQFIVMLRPGHTIESLQTAFPTLKNRGSLSKRMNIFLLERNTTASAEDFLLILKRNEHVKLAQFNHRNVKQRALIPNDTDFGQQWNMLNTGQNVVGVVGIPGADIEATEAWAINHGNITADGDTIVIAIIDGQFELAHEDLNYFTNYNEVPGNDIDDDGNGYIDDVNGWNVFDTSGNINSTGPGSPHSTHCAGIAAAIGNNGKGVAGVCWGAQILPVAGSSEEEDKVIMAYDYVLTMRTLYNNTFGTKGAFVVSTNSSFGVDNGNPVNFPIWCALYDTMGFEGILSAAATANAGVDIDAVHDIPTECPSNWLISVTNTINTDKKHLGAAYGKNSIDIGAPGYFIHSTVPTSAYSNMTGTSMASPHLAGTVGAMYAAACKAFIDKYHEQPDSMALLVKKYILESAEWNSSLNNITTTNGRLNLFRAITTLKKYNCDSCGFSIGVTQNPIVCKGDADGTATLTFSTGSASDYNILWNNNATFATVQDLAPGFYVATVTDTLTGCARVTTAAFHNPDTIVISFISTIPSVGGNPGNITVHASAGNDTLQYSLDGVNYQITPTLSVPSNGTYVVYVKNSLGCVVQQTVVVSGIEDLAANNWEFSVYPNPAANELNVFCQKCAEQKVTLEVWDVTGRKLFSEPATSILSTLETMTWSNGLYYLTIEANHQKVSRRFVINK
jgi:hypothetical protein